MPTTTATRLRTRLLPIAVLALLAAGCGGETARQASPARSATPSASSVKAQPLTAAELRWIRAVEQLQPRMTKVFTDMPTDLTTAALVTLAGQLGQCRHELRRLGPSSARLQPVQALVDRACGQYDKGAACFAAVARDGLPSSTAPVEVVSKHLDCGIASMETGGKSLVEAQLLTTEIRNAAG